MAWDEELPGLVVTPDEDYDWGLDDDWWQNDQWDDDNYDDSDYDDPQGEWGGDSSSEKNDNIVVSGDSGTRKEYKLKDTDILVREKKKIPKVSKQVGASCVTAIMEYLSKLLDGKEVNQGVFDIYYLQITGQFIHESGLDYNKDGIENIVSHFYNTTDEYINIKTAVEDGYPVMTDIKTAEENNFHNVLVIGHNNTDYIAADTSFGGFITLKGSDFANHYSIVITGKTENCK